MTPPYIVEPHSSTSIKCYRCEICPFISINQENLYSHIEKHTQRKFVRKKYYCGGCDNIFYEKNVLERHLLEDHMMSRDETNTLTEYILKCNPFGPSRKGKGKNRIFIKNVTQLKKPDLIESPTTTHTENSTNKDHQSKSKIFIESVQLLKGPEFCFSTCTTPSQTNDVNQTDPVQNFNNNNYDETESTGLFQNIFDLHQSTVQPYYHTDESFGAIVSEASLTTVSEPISSTSNNGKIFLRDISALQDPRPKTVVEHQEQRPIHPTLHLKTVDELNSMTLSEVQNLQVLNSDGAYQNNYDEMVGNDKQDFVNQNNNDEVIVLDENEISDLIQLNSMDGNYSQNSFSDLLNCNEFDISMENPEKFDCFGDGNKNEAPSDMGMIENLAVMAAENGVITETDGQSIVVRIFVLCRSEVKYVLFCTFYKMFHAFFRTSKTKWNMTRFRS